LRGLRVVDVFLPVQARRLSAVVLTSELLARMSGNAVQGRPFVWPEWWPDHDDQ
jgi:hypothetical protein